MAVEKHRQVLVSFEGDSVKGVLLVAEKFFDILDNPHHFSSSRWLIKGMTVLKEEYLLC